MWEMSSCRVPQNFSAKVLIEQKVYDSYLTTESDTIKHELDQVPEFVKLAVQSLVFDYIELQKKLKHKNPFHIIRHYVTTQCATVTPSMLVLVTNAYEYHNK